MPCLGSEGFVWAGGKELLCHGGDVKVTSTDEGLNGNLHTTKLQLTSGENLERDAKRVVANLFQ